MKFGVSINVMPRAEISDPQGQAVERALPGLGLNSISAVRVGKRITLQVEAEDRDAAGEKVAEACRKILANPVIEDFSFDIIEAAAPEHVPGGAGK